MPNDAAHLARALARTAATVCAHYLSNGRRQGRYWQVGDVHNTAGRSLFVRLTGPDYGPGAAGKWTDAATGQHGDLLDLIALNRGIEDLKAILAEARYFLSLPPPLPSKPVPVARNSSAAVQRLFHASKPVPGTLAEVYLRGRGITCALDLKWLRFHPSCYCRVSEGAPLLHLPAMIAAVTDLAGKITAAHRTWLAEDGRGKAPIEEPRKALGHVLGNAVRFGRSGEALAAGEGIETMLAVRSLVPSLPCAAALSANHLALLELPAGLHHLYIAVDNDQPGRAAAFRLLQRARRLQIDVQLLIPQRDDWNSDLITLGYRNACTQIARQLTDPSWTRETLWPYAQ